MKLDGFKLIKRYFSVAVEDDNIMLDYHIFCFDDLNLYFNGNYILAIEDLKTDKRYIVDDLDMMTRCNTIDKYIYSRLNMSILGIKSLWANVEYKTLSAYKFQQLLDDYDISIKRKMSCEKRIRNA